MDKLARACQSYAKAMAEVGVDALWVTDNYAGKNGPFMNPIMFREYELPYLKAIVNIGKRYGIPVSEAF